MHPRALSCRYMRMHEELWGRRCAVPRASLHVAAAHACTRTWSTDPPPSWAPSLFQVEDANDAAAASSGGAETVVVGALGALSCLDMASLHHLLSILQADFPESCGPVRLTCSGLRDEHDACSRQLKIRNPRGRADKQPPHLKRVLAGLVRRMPQLRSLHVDPVNSAFPFAYMLEQAAKSACGAALRDITLQGSSGLRVLAPMARFPLLERLVLSDCDCVESIEPLSQLTRLKVLMLKGAWRLEDLSPLSACTALESVHLESLCINDMVRDHHPRPLHPAP
jgi:hypothetical protein